MVCSRSGTLAHTGLQAGTQSAGVITLCLCAGTRRDTVVLGALAVVQHTRQRVAHLCCIPLALTHLPNKRDILRARNTRRARRRSREAPCSEDDFIVKIGLDSPPAALSEGVSIAHWRYASLGEGGGSGS